MNYENLMAEQSDSALEKEFEALLGNGYTPSKQGELIQGKVVLVSKDHVVIDIGYKSEGHIPLNQFKDNNGKISVNEGDVIEVLMLATESEDGELVLSYDKAQQLKIWNKLEEIQKTGTHIVGRVVQKVKGGLQVDIGVPAFLPGSQIDVRPQRNLDRFIGQDLDLKVLKYNRDRGNIVLSRRAVLEEERTTLKKDTIDKISEGTIVEGTVKNVTHYGVFIDLGGIDGLLHITDMSWGRVNHPNEMLQVGQTVQVVVLKYDDSAERVSLGMKQLHENPWEKIQAAVRPGSTVKGAVVSLTDYGAFVKLDEGIEGLIHVSEMSWTKKIKHPSKVVSIGDVVEAVVLEVSAENQRISLGLKQLTPNPWEELKNDFPAGTKVNGTVRSVTDFGIFVNIKDDIDGLVHVSDFSWTKRVKDPKEITELYKKGDKVDVVVLEIDPKNERLSLGIKQLEPDIWQSVPARYPNGAKVKGLITNVTEFGIFVKLEEGVEGLIHISQIPTEKDEDINTKYKAGDEIEAEVTSVDKLERRISLSLKQSKRKQREEFSPYLEEDNGAAVTFGDLLQQQMKK